MEWQQLIAITRETGGVLVLTLVVGLLLAVGYVFLWPRLIRATVGRTGAATWVIWVIATTVALISAAGAHDSAGFFGQTTAAWAQGLGSIIAIAAAIWIDQGAARRLRDDRTRERLDAVASRRGAIQSCAQNLVSMADQLSTWNPKPGHDWHPAMTRLRALEGARNALNYYLRIASVEIDVRLVAALTTAEQVMGDAVTHFTSHLPIHPGQRDDSIERLQTAAEQLLALDEGLDA